MHNLASNNKHSHGVEGSETSLLQSFAGQFSQSQLSAVKPKASWVVVMYTMNNHTYNVMESVTAGLIKHYI